MNNNAKQPNNRAIALLVILNLIATLCILIYLSKPNISPTVAYANSLEEIEPAQKISRDNIIEEIEKEDEVLFKIESVTDHSEKTGTIPLYFSHANEHGTYFTYIETEQPNTWTQGYWYIDYNTLELANIKPTQLRHNDEIQGVFYTTNDSDYFEIKEVVAISNSYK